VAHGENLRVLIYEENADAAESLAGLLRDADYPLQLNLVNETAKLETELESASPDIMICGARLSSTATETARAILAGCKPGLPVINVSDIPPGQPQTGADSPRSLPLVSYDEPAEIMRAFDREVEILRLREDREYLRSGLETAEQRLLDFIEQSSDAVAYLKDGVHAYANPAYLELFALPRRNDLEGTGILDLLESGDRERFNAFMQAACSHQESSQVASFNCRKVNGEIFGCSMHISSATLTGNTCSMIIIRPRHRVSELQDRLTDLAHRDFLTGLYNRQYFMKLSAECLDNLRVDDAPCALFYILLDNFKPLRECAGVVASDVLLRHIGILVSEHAGNNGYAARFGEYSFTILYRDCSEERIQQLGEDLLHAISRHVSEIDGQTLGTTCSIGICSTTGHANTADKLVSRADLACEVARSAGGNQLHIHSVVVNEQIAGNDDEHWREVVSKTINENRLYLIYQPIVSLKGGDGKRYEVLLRVVDEAGHVILPSQFLAIAERTGLSSSIDRWIINRSFKQLAEHRRQQGDVEFFIKLSNITIKDPRIPAWIRTQLEHFELDSESITFEIPEDAVIRDLRNSMLFARALEKVNCKVALEHYGHANQPQLLDHFPARFLKIDSRLIRSLSSNKEQQERITDIVKHAHERKIKCMAECVEDAGDLARLWRCGVDYIQGNFVQEPSCQLRYDFESEIA